MCTFDTMNNQYLVLGEIVGQAFRKAKPLFDRIRCNDCRGAVSTPRGASLTDRMNPTSWKCTPKIRNAPHLQKWGASETSGIIIRVLCH